MAVERIPCGGWDIDNSTLQFQGKVLKAVGGITGAYLPLSGGIMEADAVIEGTDNIEISVGDDSQSAVVGVTQSGVTIEHNTNSQADSSIRAIENAVEISTNGTTVTINGTGINMGGSAISGVNSLTGNNEADIAIENQIDMNNHKITLMAEPTNPQDAATMNYVDISVNAAKNCGLFGVKKSETLKLTLPDAQDYVYVSYLLVEEAASGATGTIQYLYTRNGSGSSDANINVTLDGTSINISNISETGNDVIGQYYGYTTNNQ